MSASEYIGLHLLPSSSVTGNVPRKPRPLGRGASLERQSKEFCSESQLHRDPAGRVRREKEEGLTLSFRLVNDGDKIDFWVHGMGVTL